MHARPHTVGLARAWQVCILRDGRTTVEGLLHDGRTISYELDQPKAGATDELVGLIEPERSDGEPRYFVKALLASGEYLFCHVSGYKVRMLPILLSRLFCF